MSARRARMRRNGRSRTGLIALQVLAAVAAVAVVLSGIVAASGYALVDSWLKDLPDYTKPGAFEVARATRIYSADGKLLARLYLENREVIPIGKMSQLPEAVVAVEDERFYKHHGVDPVGLTRAVVKNVEQGFGTQGASTITQQYVRNTILLDERTQISLARKVREAYLALQLEKRYSKKQILEMYLNAIYFGEGAYGAQAASLTYFAKPASQLTLDEAALLAGLPQQPSRLNPYENPKGAIARREQVLARMLKNGYITASEYETARVAKLHLRRAKQPEDGIYEAPYFVAHVKKELQAKFSPAVVFKGGLTVRTTLDTRLQAFAEKAVRDKIGGSGPEGALVSIDPRNGYVKALVGGRDFKKNKFNLATQGKRQPGSSFKTFVLVTALSEGMPPYYMVDSSSPAYIPTKPKPWVVSNSEGSGRGMITLRSATAASVNTVYARVAWAIGADKIAKVARRMGITSDLPPFPSIALGARNVSPYEMASAYGTLANGGVHNEPVVITQVIDSSGETIFRAKPKGKRAISARVAAAATEVLRGVVTGGTGTRANIGRPVAGKTGTSQLNRDVWFVGYTPQLVTSVWVGYPQERSIYVNGSRAYGGTVCAPIWAAYMRRALAGQPVLKFARLEPPPYDGSKFHIPRSKTPKVTGLTLADASKRLGGLTFTVEYVYSAQPIGHVVGQVVKDNRLVLLVSKGPKTAPVQPGGGTTDPGGGGTTDPGGGTTDPGGGGTTDPGGGTDTSGTPTP